VLNTVELLEKIILELSCQQVLAIKGVSKRWNDTVTGSLRLQVALCFKPLPLLRCGHSDDARSACTNSLEDDKRATEWNLESLTPRPDDPVMAGIFYDTALSLSTKRIAALNPFLPDCYRQLPYAPLWGTAFDLEGFRSFEDLGLPKNMLLSQPPVTEMIVTILVESAYKTRYGLAGTRLNERFKAIGRLHSVDGLDWDPEYNDGMIKPTASTDLVNPSGITMFEFLACHKLATEACQEFEPLGLDEEDWSIELVFWQEDEDEHSKRMR